MFDRSRCLNREPEFGLIYKTSGTVNIIQTGGFPTSSRRKIVERELFRHRAHANCFRAIGDGIAWRAFKHDRAALRALSGNAVKQQILDQGTINELHQWSATFDTGQGLAILNSLTNWLAIG